MSLKLKVAIPDHQEIAVPCKQEKDMWFCVLQGAIEEALGGGVKEYKKRKYFDTNEREHRKLISDARLWLSGQVESESGVNIFLVLEWLGLEYDKIVRPVFKAIDDGKEFELLMRVSPARKSQIKME